MIVKKRIFQKGTAWQHVHRQAPTLLGIIYLYVDYIIIIVVIIINIYIYIFPIISRYVESQGTHFRGYETKATDSYCRGLVELGEKSWQPGTREDTKDREDSEVAQG